MPNPHELTSREAVQPYSRVVECVPSDTEDFEPPRAIFVGGTGDLSCAFADDPTYNAFFRGLQGGGAYPFAVCKIFATDTSATDILLLY